MDSALLNTDTTQPPMTDASIDTVYRMRVDLIGANPPIWRRIEVPDCSLAELHCAVQAAMDRMQTPAHAGIPCSAS